MITIQVDEKVDERLAHMAPAWLQGLRSASQRVAWGVDELERLKGNGSPGGNASNKGGVEQDLPNA